jgi:glucose/arabinose dehydrogenase/PKD repeat protein
MLAAGLAAPLERAGAATLPPGFQESVAFSGLVQPTAIRFAPDGHVFVAEKRGTIKVFKGTGDTNPVVFSDLRTNVYNFWDRGLLGLAVHPSFPAEPYVYVLYTYDGDIGQNNAPKWGTGTDTDPCPTPPGATADGCVVSGRLSRIAATIDAAGILRGGPEQVLIEDWCQQYPSHSIGSLVFGRDGALYVSSGDGASFNFMDSGQVGNPCGDPLSEGGALRSQDLRTSSDPVTLDGTILRLDPATGAGLPTNPLAASPDANARRILAYGLRNPFRMNVRPGTNNELWVGDVGWNSWEEVNFVTDTSDGTLRNFGWPCYEGNARHPSYDSANLPICENLYAAPSVTAPWFVYSHVARLYATDPCAAGSSSIAGIAFNPGGGPYPSTYDGAMFFADYSRNCIWSMLRGDGGTPNMSTVQAFVASAAGPVELQMSPAGELLYPDFNGGRIRRIQYCGVGNACPLAILSASATSGTAPFTVTLSGAGSSDPNAGDVLAYAWDLDNDQAFDDATSAQTSWTFTQAGTHLVRLRVTDSQSAYDIASLVIHVEPGAANNPPNAVLNASATSGTAPLTVTFDGSASSDPDGQAITYAWDLNGDQIYGDATTPQASRTFTQAGSYVVGLRVTDTLGASDTKTLTINVTAAANTPPVPTITSPGVGTTWKVGDVITFAGTASDAQDGTLPASALSWSLALAHCPSTCHTHPLQTFSGVAGGSFTAPDHEYPSHLELTLTARDSGGLTSSTTLRLDPRTVTLTFQTVPGGLKLAVGGTQSTGSFSRTVIVGSRNTISAPSPQLKGKQTYRFQSWSDGGAQSHDIFAPATATLYTARFAR